MHRRRLWVPGSPAAPRNDGAGGGTDRPPPGMRNHPRARLAPGAWPKKRTRGTRDAAGTQVSASQRAGSDPRGARGIARAGSPAGAVFLVAASVRRPGPAPACQAVSGEAHAPPEPAISVRGLPAVRPPRSGRIRRVRRLGPEAGRRGGISAPAGQTTARSHARHRDTPRTGTPPGAMAAESHRRGRRPTPGPARSATGRAPEGRSGIAPGPPWAGAVRKHKIGTLSRWGAMRQRV